MSQVKCLQSKASLCTPVLPAFLPPILLCHEARISHVSGGTYCKGCVEIGVDRYSTVLRFIHHESPDHLCASSAPACGSCDITARETCAHATCLRDNISTICRVGDIEGRGYNYILAQARCTYTHLPLVPLPESTLEWLVNFFGAFSSSHASQLSVLCRARLGYLRQPRVTPAKKLALQRIIGVCDTLRVSQSDGLNN